MFKTTPGGGVAVVSRSNSNGATGFYNPTVAGGKLYFTCSTSASGSELWVTDGTSDGTKLVKDIWAGSSSSNPGTLTPVGSTLMFLASNGENGRELWVSDGTASGTNLLNDVRPGTADASFSGMGVVMKGGGVLRGQRRRQR